MGGRGGSCLGPQKEHWWLTGALGFGDSALSLWRLGTGEHTATVTSFVWRPPPSCNLFSKERKRSKIALPSPHAEIDASSLTPSRAAGMCLFRENVQAALPAKPAPGPPPSSSNSRATTHYKEEFSSPEKSLWGAKSSPSSWRREITHFSSVRGYAALRGRPQLGPISTGTAHIPPRGSVLFLMSIQV